MAVKDIAVKKRPWLLLPDWAKKSRELLRATATAMPERRRGAFPATTNSAAGSLPRLRTDPCGSRLTRPAAQPGPATRRAVSGSAVGHPRCDPASAEPRARG